MRKKGLLSVIVKSATCMHGGAKIRVRVDSELAEELNVKVRMHKGLVLSPLPMQFC